MPIENLQESEDSKRDRLFERWLEVSARVESVQNMMVKTDLQAYLERLSVKIGGNDVTKLETEIKQELESLWRAVIYSIYIYIYIFQPFMQSSPSDLLNRRYIIQY